MLVILSYCLRCAIGIGSFWIVCASARFSCTPILDYTCQKARGNWNQSVCPKRVVTSDALTGHLAFFGEQKTFGTVGIDSMYSSPQTCVKIELSPRPTTSAKPLSNYKLILCLLQISCESDRFLWAFARYQKLFYILMCTHPALLCF